MAQRFFDGVSALCYGSLMLTSNMNKTQAGQSFEGLRGPAPARKKRTALSGGMFNHNTRLYRQRG